MGYAIAGVLVLLVITAVIVPLLHRPPDKNKPPAGGRGTAPGIGADAESPFGDTSQHAGVQEGGETVAGADADKYGGAGRRRGGQGTASASGIGENRDDPHVAAHVQRPGEGEGETTV